MFQDQNLWQLIVKGGPIMMVLAACSILSWTLILERGLRYWRATRGSERLSARVSKLARAGKLNDAMEMAQAEEGCVAEVLKAGLAHGGRERAALSDAMERRAAEQVMDLESRIGVLGTLASVAPYIGLFGTVMGIISAFRALAESKEAGAAVVSAGIAEALVATAAGLFVAVPSAIAYNAYARKAANLDTRMALASSELVEALAERGPGRGKEDKDVEA